MKISTSFVIAVFALSPGSTAFSFTVDTHRALSARTVTSTVHDFLTFQLGLAGGIDEPLSNGTETMTVNEWIQEGSVREDDSLRFFNHFHNPLRTWDEAGLRIFGGQLGRSSIRWTENLLVKGVQ